MTSRKIDMTKRNIHVTVDEDTHNLAVNKGLNISGIVDEALYSKVHQNMVEIGSFDNLKCDWCGTPGERERAEDCEAIVNIKDPVKNPTKLTWLWPDERWICNRCLRKKTRRVPVGGGVHS